jgi:hypothetical protein
MNKGREEDPSGASSTASDVAVTRALPHLTNVSVALSIRPSITRSRAIPRPSS